MIARLWHGYTTRENAHSYRQLLLTKILPSIEQEHGHRVQLMVRDVPGTHEVEFITICYFDHLDEIKAFAGEDYEKCVVPDEARALLKHFEERSQHYSLLQPGP